MAPPRDLYELLGVSRNATQEEIRKAYLKLAHKHHPDKTGGDKASEEKLKEVNAAYDILKNPEKRSRYDQFGATDGSSPFGQGGFGGFGAGGFGGGVDSPFEDLFDMLFGQGPKRRRSTAQPGSDLELHLRVTLEEAAFGVKKEAPFSCMEPCEKCGGSGAAPGSRPEPCTQCGGAGQVRMAQGFFSVTRPCPRCRGAGTVIAKPCRDCAGSGRVKANRKVSVNVPPGVETGSRLRDAGKGEAGVGGGPRGDLYIYIEVAPHPIFERDGTMILCEVPISIAQATLGDTIRVPTLEGEAQLKVPAGTQSGAHLRLRGLGMPDLRGYRQGDQIVRLVVETPAKLSRRQKELLKEFEELSGEHTYPLRQNFKKKLRESGD